jgi:N-acetylmuramoyl-L-alanine amidase
MFSDFRQKKGTTRSWFILTLSIIISAVAFPIWVQAEALETNKILVILDPGHGGEDAGIIYPDLLPEKALMLDLAKRLQNELREAYKVEAILSRTADTEMNHADRAFFANRRNPALFLSLHLQGPLMLDQAQPGFYLRPFYTKDFLSDRARTAQSWNIPVLPWDLAQNPFHEKSRALARALSKAWNKIPDATNSKAHAGFRGAALASFRGVRCPAVLLEIPAHGRKKRWEVNDARQRDKIAQGLAAGIHDFITRR